MAVAVSVELTDCIVLHRRPWRETSLIVDALAREHGRVALVARGARRPKNRWSGVLEPLGRVSLSWRGRGEMPTLTDAQPEHGHRLTGNRLMAGLYSVELVMRLCARHDPQPAVFDSLAGLVEVLDAGAPAIVAVRFFERDLLAALGYGMDLAHAADTGQAIVAGRRYNFVADIGFETADTDAPEMARETVDGRVLIGLRDGRFANADDVRAARDVCRRALMPHLGDRPLQSVATARAMQRLHSQPATSVSDCENPSANDCTREPES